MQQGEMLYEGKAKQVFLTDDPDMILIHYKDAATAFNNIKKATIENKGVLNNRISTLIFEYLNKQGIKTHYVKTLNDRDQLCRRVRIIPLEARTSPPSSPWARSTAAPRATSSPARWPSVWVSRRERSLRT